MVLNPSKKAVSLGKGLEHILIQSFKRRLERASAIEAMKHVAIKQA